MYLACVLKAPVDRYCRPEQKCGINKNEKKGNFEETSGMDKSQSGQTILFASALQSETCDQIKDFKMTPGYCTVGNIQTK